MNVIALGRTILKNTVEIIVQEEKTERESLIGSSSPPATHFIRSECVCVCASTREQNSKISRTISALNRVRKTSRFDTERQEGLIPEAM